MESVQSSSFFLLSTSELGRQMSLKSRHSHTPLQGQWCLHLPVLEIFLLKSFSRGAGVCPLLPAPPSSGFQASWAGQALSPARCLAECILLQDLSPSRHKIMWSYTTRLPKCKCCLFNVKLSLEMRDLVDLEHVFSYFGTGCKYIEQTILHRFWLDWDIRANFYYLWSENFLILWCKKKVCHME